MGAGDPELVGGHTIEHAPAHRTGRLRIDVEDQRGIGTGDLDRREMNEIAPDQQALVARLDEPAGMTRRMAGEQHRRHARQHLAIAHGAHALTIGRGRHARLGDIAADALAGAARLVAVEPECRLRLVQQELCVGIDGASVIVDQPVGMVGMDVGQQDGIDAFRRDADGAKAVGELAERRPEGVAGAGIDQRACAVELEQKCVHRDVHRLTGPLAGKPLGFGARAQASPSNRMREDGRRQ